MYIKLLLLIVTMLATPILAAELPPVPGPPDIRQYFTPKDSGSSIYIAEIDKHATKQLLVVDFTFNSEPITEEYIKLAKRGVKVRLLLDRLEFNSVSGTKPLVKQLRAAGCEVVITTSPVKHAILHSKYSIIDEDEVIFGSYNYSTQADFQANTLTIIVSSSWAATFIEDWNYLYSFATSPANTARQS
jgi:phospholipase D